MEQKISISLAKLEWAYIVHALEEQSKREFDFDTAQQTYSLSHDIRVILYKNAKEVKQ